MSARRFRRALLAVASLALLYPAAAGAQTLPAGFFTMNGNELKNDTPLRDLHVALVAATGATAVRADLLWNTFESVPPVADPAAPGGVRRTFDFPRYDQFVAALARHGLTWRPLLINSPYWNRVAGGTWTSPPADPTQATGLVSAFFGRYGVGGTFWAENPGLTPRPVRWMEAWNEPNYAPSNNSAYRYPPAGFARFLRAVAEGARSVDSGAQIVVGGLVPHTSTTTKGISVVEFLNAVAAAEPTVAGMTSGVATHIFGTKSADAWYSLGRMRDQVVSTPFKYSAIHLNETGSPVRPADVLLGEPVRATFLESMVKRSVAASGAACHMGSVAPYTWLTPELDPLLGEDWFGISNLDGSLRPSAVSYTNAVASAIPGNGACGTATLK